jgi:diguanylate cyclase (GGDEF)-like protein
MDFLTAEREIGMILNSDVEMTSVGNRVVEVTSNLLGTDPGGEVKLYLASVEGEGPRLVACRNRGRQTETRMLKQVQGDRDWLSRVLDDGRVVLASEGESLRIVLPLLTDGGWIGLLEAVIPFSGDPSRREQRLGLLAPRLEEYSKIVALAVRAPDLYTRAVVDGLTGLASRRHFTEQLREQFSQSQRYPQPFSLIMMDIDHFKVVNDTYGHPAGDAVLCGVAEIIRKNIRKAGDTATRGFRYGGEELAVLLPRSDLTKAREVAERLRKAIETHGFSSGRRRFRITASLGVAQHRPGMTAPDALIREADDLLYKAKQAGRNRVECAG